MYIIIGLGNPGPKYEHTRHNAGYMFLDTLSQKTKWLKNKSGIAEKQWINIEGHEVELVKPLTFMNRSGEAVKYAMSKQRDFTLDHLIIAHDDLDIPLGQSKLQFAKGPKQHNGISSIESILKTDQFWRLRLGVENRGGTPIPGQTYVLQDFTQEEITEFDQGLSLAVEKVREHIRVK